ncbi:hypothetical protein JTE90_018222 [Oedothorax gibbosus]|uniref:MULE transposase domain-containing protein n=1 Tax=Oedothorax gibbosus TaxID=931172 RepID=A0AAV6U949_9ARAC|nr:hypothetical protein JTE90_018222 [Oedothorax gibbosus]
MKEKVKDTNDTPQNILCDVASGCSRSAAGQMPNSAALKKTIRRTRAQVSHVPVVPSSLNELDLPAVYCKTEKGADFLLYDSGSTSSNDRILVFGTNENLNFLQNSKHWFADGTFKTSPNLFTQLYTIHAIVKNENVPVLFALLPSKSEAIYKKLFNAIKSLNPQLNPQTILLDFERAAMNAFLASFPTASVRGCFFHFSQAIWRKIQAIGLQAKYANDGDFALEIRQLAAMAFLPPQDVISSFEMLMDTDFFQEINLVPLVDYFEDTWIGRIARNGRRREPLFPIEMWNCFSSVVDGLPKTNNSIEG